MDTLCSTVLLLTVPHWVLSQVTLKESGPGLMRPTQTLTLTCSFSGFSLSTSNMGVAWVRQPPGKALEWLANIWWNDNKYYSSSLRSRLTISKDTSKNQVVLTIISMDPADRATYYCVRIERRELALDYWGQGTLVTVSSESSSAPALFPLVSCENVLLDENLVAMGCLARDFLPSSVSFSWSYKNNSAIGTSAITSFPSVLRGGKYLATSQLFLPSESILKGLDEFVTCSVKHSAGNKNVQVPLTVPKDVPPNVTVFVPPRDGFSNSGSGLRTSKLLCQATGFSPKQISVSWLQDGKQVDSGVTTDKVEAEPKGSGPLTYRVTSSLVITEIQWLSQSVFTCHVEHGNMSFKKNVSSMCGTGTSAGIRIFTIAPSFASIFITKTATLSCLVTDLATYDSLYISWTRQNGEPLETHVNVSESHPNATFSAKGVATVCVEDWQSGEEFTCTVTHMDLPSPRKDTISKPKEAARHMPSVYVLPPTQEQLSLQELASVTCLVKGFSPSDVFVQWMQRGQPVAPSAYVTSAPMPEPQTPNLYFVYSILTVNTDDWLRGETYTCVVGHEALPHSVTERTVDKSTEGELGAEEEGFENLNTMASTFIVLFLLSLFYSTTVTLFKVK